MNSDYFEALQEPHRPWLDVEALKERFLKLSSDVHPDRFHAAPEAERLEATERYATLNAAYTALKEPKDRLLHLLQLETESSPRDIQKIPPGTMDLFVEIGQTCRDVDTFLQERTKATSPLVKVQLFRQGHTWVETLRKLQSSVTAKRDQAMDELRSMNQAWSEAEGLKFRSSDRQSKLPLERLEQLYRTLSYVARWTEQIQQRIVELATRA